MTHVGFAPDRIRLFRAQHLQRNRLHRRDGRELDKPLGLGVAELCGGVSDSVEAGDEQPGSPFGTGFAGHVTHVGDAVGRPGYGTLSRVHMFESNRSTSGRPSDAPKLREPAANTFAPAGVS